MKLKVKNATVNATAYQIALKLQAQTGNPIDIVDKGSNILITCPFHKNGKESKPSCSIVTDEYNEYDEVGTFQCWACKEKGHISKIVSKILSLDYESAEEWILNNFSNSVTEEIFIDDEINLNETNEVKLSLDKYEPLTEHAYKYLEEQRHLKRYVVDYFGVCYNRETDSVVFPVFDANKKPLLITERCIGEKRFNISKGLTKPIYLLPDAQKYKTVYVCESQINTLTLWGWKKPAIGLIGTGSKEQYDMLNRSGIHNFILCLDGDMAGKEGTKRFIKNIKHAIIQIVKIPEGKDVNDLTEEEFNNLPIVQI